MTNEEKQEIVNEVLAALQTHGKTIGQLTPVTSPSDSDTFELSGGRNLSYGKLKELITAIFTAALNGYVPADALWEYIQQYVAKLGTNGALDWQESPVVMLATMGTTYDNVDGELPAYTLQEGDMYYQYGVNFQIFRRPANGGGEGKPAKEGVVYFNMRTMRLYKWTGSTMVGIAKVGTRVINDLTTGGEGDALSAEMGKKLKELIDNMGIDGSSIIKDVTYRNGDLVFTFETSEGDKVVNVPLDIDLSGYVPVTRKVNGKALSQDITIGQSDISGLAAALAALVPQTRTINGKALSSNVTIGMSDIQGLVEAINNAGSGAVSVTTNQDGTFVIHVGSTDYTVNLNHTHENMAKLIVCEESDLPSTLDNSTIYAQVDDADTPTEIQSLWIAGLEFVGGGGASDDTPRLITPRDGLTLDFDEQSTIQLPVRGKNLLADLSLSVSGDFTVTDGNGTAVSTITAAAANDGVVLLLTKGSNYDSGTLRIFSSEVDVTVTLEKDSLLPAGYSPLEAVSVNSMILSLANTNIPILSSWRLVLRSSSSSSAQVAICQNASRAGRYFGVVAGSKWGVASAAAINGVSVTAKTEALVEFGTSLSKLTIGDNVVTTTPATFNEFEGNQIELFGCSEGDHYYFSGYVYEIECVSGGSFHALPAKRLSDNAVGLYDIENDVFYTGFSS